MIAHGLDRTWGVFLIPVDGIDHQKFWVAVAPSGTVWHGLFINSELSQYDARNAAIMASTVTLSESNYRFLSHDSYFSATEHIIVPEAELVDAQRCGIIHVADRLACVRAIRDSETLKIRVRDNMLRHLGVQRV